jgi:hypothetical protein
VPARWRPSCAGEEILRSAPEISERTSDGGASLRKSNGAVVVSAKADSVKL